MAFLVPGLFIDSKNEFTTAIPLLIFQHIQQFFIHHDMIYNFFIITLTCFPLKIKTVSNEKFAPFENKLLVAPCQLELLFCSHENNFVNPLVK